MKDEDLEVVVPPMKVKMQIIHMEIAKEAPKIMNLIKANKKLDVFTVHCLPVSVIESQNLGWRQLQKLYLDEYSDKLAESYSTDRGVFAFYIPMTRHTIEVNNYEPGSIFTLEVKGFE